MSDNLNTRVALNSTTYMCICYASPEQNVDDDNTLAVRVVWIQSGNSYVK